MCLSGEPGNTNLKVAMGRVYETAEPCNCAKLRAALVGLVGEEDVENLKRMASFIEKYARTDADAAVSLNAIRVLIETAGK